MRIFLTKTFIGPTLGALALALCLATGAHGDTLKESWYMSRGKANMEIQNYKAAIEAFEKLIEINPANREALRLLGSAYELQGLTDKAIAHYDRYLALFPDDAEIAFKQAHYLEDARFAYRKKDAIRYYRMGLKVKEHHENRHRLAKLLAADKTTLDEAVHEYRVLIKTDSHDPLIREEYRKLLLWDDRYLPEAMEEYEKAVKEHPGQFALQHQLAKLYLKDKAHTQEAIQQYGKLVRERPQDVTLRKEYARALAKSDRNFEEAKEQFQIALRQTPDYPTQVAYADHLAKRETTRDEALSEYAQLVRTSPNDTDVRLKYARLLGARLETIDSAIAQYKVVLDQAPKNSTAHRELARAYAWKGDNDRSIYHSKLALEYDSQDASAYQLKHDLMKGREPTITAGLTYLNQSGDDRNYDYDGFVLKASGKADLTPFLTGRAEVGRELYRDDDRDVDGTLYGLGLQYRFDPSHRLDAQWYYHDFDKGEGGSEFLVQYTLHTGNYLITPGIRRDFKYDSLLAIAGDTDEATQRKIGAARALTAFCQFAYRGERLEAAAMPYLGYVSADSTDKNTLIGADADARVALLRAGAFGLAALYKLQISHYEEDDSGFAASDEEPFAGGYFSPDLFANNVLDLEFSYQVQEQTELRLSAGPSLQYVQEHSEGGNWHTGVDLHLACQIKLSSSLYVTADSYYFEVADIYRKYALTALIGYRF